ncbi:MAG TPA: phage tail protein [Polyangiaceae bacterium]|nr:phage tail protein [Polyangiaceae bacterium]
MLALGDLLELPTKSVREIRGEDGATWAAHEVIMGRPLGQFMGPSGQKLSIALFLHIDFIGPRPTITKLREIKDRGEVFAVTTSSGAEWGTYKIDSVSHRIVSSLEDGRVICAHCDLALSDPGYDVPVPVQAPLALAGNAQNTTASVPVEDTSRPLDEVLVEEIARV